MVQEIANYKDRIYILSHSRYGVSYCKHCLTHVGIGGSLSEDFWLWKESMPPYKGSDEYEVICIDCMRDLQKGR